MSWFVYIIQNDFDDDLYKGISENPIKRLEEHNAGLSKFTAAKLPWKIVCFYEMESKKHAIIEEKRVKKLNKKSLLKIINSDSNIFNQ